jgi:acetyltransferase-like isoleucine patch superfamily enzyme
MNLERMTRLRRLKTALRLAKRWYRFDRQLSSESKICESANIHYTSDVGGLGKLLLKSGSYIGPYSFISVGEGQSLTIGSNSTIHSFGIINGDIFIGRDVLIGPRVTILSGTHIIDGPGSIRQNDSLYLQSHGNYFSRTVLIGDDCWIGANAVIMPGVKLGRGCVVGANAVVTRSYEDYSVITGIPGKRRRYRMHYASQT